MPISPCIPTRRHRLPNWPDIWTAAKPFQVNSQSLSASSYPHTTTLMQPWIRRHFIQKRNLDIWPVFVFGILFFENGDVFVSTLMGDSRNATGGKKILSWLCSSILLVVSNVLWRKMCLDGLYDVAQSQSVYNLIWFSMLALCLSHSNSRNCIPRKPMEIDESQKMLQLSAFSTEFIQNLMQYCRKVVMVKDWKRNDSLCVKVGRFLMLVLVG